MTTLEARLQSLEESLADIRSGVDDLAKRDVARTVTLAQIAEQNSWLVEQVNVALQGLAQTPMFRTLFRTKTKV